MTRIIGPKMVIVKIVIVKIFPVFLLLILGFVPALMAQAAQTVVPESASRVVAAPVTPPPGALPKVFISSLPGEDELPKGGGPGESYNRFYAAMQKLGPYELVTDPARADLIFELRYTEPWVCEHEALTDRWGEVPTPHIVLNVRDRKAQTLQATYAADAEFARLQRNVDKNLERAMETLVKRSASTPVQKNAPIALPGKPVAGPVPSPFGSATTIFISDSIDNRTRSAMDNPRELYAQVYAAMQSWGRYKLVSSASEAELIAEMAITETTGPRCADTHGTIIRQSLELRIVVPNTKTVIWGFSQPLIGYNNFWTRPGFRLSQNGLEQTAAKVVDQVRQFAASSQRHTK